MIRVKVTYHEEPKGEMALNLELDKKINAFFKSIGFEWTGQGFNMETYVRDMGFESGEKS